jgi:hypothetical protein
VPTRMKPETSGEATGQHSLDLRGGGRQRAWKDRSRNLGDPVKRKRQVNPRGEGINNLDAAVAGNRRPLVAQKLSNVGGAKGPYGERALKEEERPDWMKIPLRKSGSISKP